MAAVSFSPTTSISSHTLSAQSMQMPALEDGAPPDTLPSILSVSPYVFLQPPANLQSAALSLAKRFLDPLATGVSEAQLQRQKENRRKRKRGEDGRVNSNVLHLKRVYLEGFGVDQVWEQARRVIDAAREEVEQALPEVEGHNESNDVFDGLTNGYDNHENGVKTVRFDEDGFEMSDSDEESLGEEGVDWEYDGDDVSGEGDMADEEQEGNEAESDAALEEDEDADVGEDRFNEDMSDDDRPTETFVADPNGLNDGFFSIDDFNKQSELLEQQDARGDPDDGAASDEEDIDWDADPLATDLRAERSSGALEDEGGEEDDENGPTFDNADLNAPEGASDDDMDYESVAEGDLDGLNGMANTNNIMYADFFAPPARKVTKKKRGRPNPHNFPAKETNGTTPHAEQNEDDMERTMSAVHRDLFEDDDPADEEDPLSDVDPSDPKSRRSTHERRQAKLAEEIRRLEAENVKRRQWTLAGEARAADRPINSLLEEDLDFERVGKPVPVITAEVSEDIEALIKRRIVAREFDEVLKRRPDDLATGANVRRGRFELEDTKPTRGLAELYEQEHLKKTDPNYVDVRDEKLKKEHREIEALWRDVSSKLDALSSWQYKPKPAAAALDIRVDAPAITMEDARPTAGGDIAGASMLAPQEIYRPGEEKGSGEIITKGGMPVAREEMSREEKLRRRRREKERIKKAGGDMKQKESKQSKDKRQIIGDLKEGGVKIIGKKGELRDVEGKAVKERQGRTGAGSFKL